MVTPAAFAGAARSTPATTAAEAAAVMIFLNIISPCCVFIDYSMLLFLVLFAN
jgi:hypothetical protein